MIMQIIKSIMFLIGFHLVIDFVCRKMNIPNRYPLLRVRLKRGEKLPIALLKYCTDTIVWGLRFVFVFVLSMLNIDLPEKSSAELEAEELEEFLASDMPEAVRARQMAAEYGGNPIDYLKSF